MIAARAAEIRTGLDTNFSEEQLRRPLSRRIAHMLIATATAATAAKLEGLADRVEALEKGGIRYVGTYQRASSYAKGDAVTHSGSLWIALKAVPEGAAPGSDPVYWQMAAKAGKPVKRTAAGSIST
ncbi:transposase [Rhizobium ruizarguesonis]|uniref:transposase n=1 Tax=Rhizobium ruizarguesonis TaxID=2081791 RepID=UPI001FE06FC5|nr:transposase [Rhizobium ruizarguesonis]